LLTGFEKRCESRLVQRDNPARRRSSCP
jgi:hypothetical protein